MQRQSLTASDRSIHAVFVDMMVVASAPVKLRFEDRLPWSLKCLSFQPGDPLSFQFPCLLEVPETARRSQYKEPLMKTQRTYLRLEHILDSSHRPIQLEDAGSPGRW